LEIKLNLLIIIRLIPPAIPEFAIR